MAKHIRPKMKKKALAVHATPEAREQMEHMAKRNNMSKEGVLSVLLLRTGTKILPDTKAIEVTVEPIDGGHRFHIKTISYPKPARGS